MRNKILALTAALALGTTAVTAGTTTSAMAARGGFGGHGVAMGGARFGGARFGGGRWAGGGWRGWRGGWRGRGWGWGWGPGVALGLGIGSLYAFGGPYAYCDPYNPYVYGYCSPYIY